MYTNTLYYSQELFSKTMPVMQNDSTTQQLPNRKSTFRDLSNAQMRQLPVQNYETD